MRRATVALLKGQNPISWAGFDPKHAFKIGPMNVRKAQESGLPRAAHASRPDHGPAPGSG
jgi:hypothetical protein